VEHPDTISASTAGKIHRGRETGDPSSGCKEHIITWEKYIEAEELEIQVLDARNRILGVEHPDTISAMGNLACTYQTWENT
jgi:hypothetical protein